MSTEIEAASLKQPNPDLPPEFVIWCQDRVYNHLGPIEADTLGERNSVLFTVSRRSGAVDFYIAVDEMGDDDMFEDGQPGPFGWIVHPSGALIVSTSDGSPVRTYAPGAWVDLDPFTPLWSDRRRSKGH